MKLYSLLIQFGVPHIHQSNQNESPISDPFLITIIIFFICLFCVIILNVLLNKYDND